MPDDTYNEVENRAKSSEAQSLAEALQRSASGTKDIFEEVAKQSKDIVSSTERWTYIMEELKKKLSEVPGDLKNILPILEEWKKNQVSVTDAIKKTTDAIDGTTKSAIALSKVFNQLENVVDLVGGKAGGVMWDMGEGVFNLGKGIASLDFASILSGIVKIGKALNEIDKYWAAVNRNVYDANASFGKMGEYNVAIVGLATDLGQRYNKSFQEVEKLIVSLAQVGVSEEHIEEVTDNILELNLKWSYLTPEKQMKDMSDYMKEFGVSSTHAQNVIRGLYLTAAELKKDIKELDMTQFYEQVSQVALSTRRLNFELGDANTYVEAFVRNLGKSPEVLTRALEMSKAFMEYGAGNIELQTYLIKQFAPPGTAGPGELGFGAWVRDGDLRRQVTVQGIRSFLEKVKLPGEEKGVPIEELSPNLLLEKMKLLAERAPGLAPAMTDVALAKLTEDPRKFTQVMNDLLKQQEKDFTNKQNMPGNISTMVDKTSTILKNVELWTETQFFTRTAGYAARTLGGGATMAQLEWARKTDPTGVAKIEDALKIIERGESTGVGYETMLRGTTPETIKVAVGLYEEKIRGWQKEAEGETGGFIQEFWSKKGPLTEKEEKASITKMLQGITSVSEASESQILKARSNIGRLYEIRIIERPRVPASVANMPMEE